MDYIPVVDLSDFISGTPERKRSFVKALGDAYHETGFVTVKNHGISDKMIEELYREVKAFFLCLMTLSLSMKNRNSQDNEDIPLSEESMQKEVKSLT